MTNPQPPTNPAAQPLPAGYVVPQFYRYSGEFRPPRRGEFYLATDRETMFLAVSDHLDDGNSPILVKLPAPAAETPEIEGLLERVKRLEEACNAAI